MFARAWKGFICIIFFSLFTVDYAVGNGVVDTIKRMFCKTVCYTKKIIREEAAHKNITVLEKPISFPVIFAEVILLTLTILILNKTKQYRTADRLDELLQDSKEALKQTNEFLEKWRLRKLPTEYSYLDEEPQEIIPLKLEVPILHMAIIDTLGTSRVQMERGDAGDITNVTNATLLSMTSLYDDILDSPENTSDEKIERSNSNRTVELSNRDLYDVIEEDGDSLDDD